MLGVGAVAASVVLYINGLATKSDTNKVHSPMTAAQVAELPTVPVTAQTGDGAQSLVLRAEGLISNSALEAQVEGKISSEASNGIIQDGATYQVPVVPRSDIQQPPQ